MSASVVVGRHLPHPVMPGEVFSVQLLGFVVSDRLRLDPAVNFVRKPNCFVRADSAWLGEFALPDPTPKRRAGHWDFRKNFPFRKELERRRRGLYVSCLVHV
jgi:hypothetical protein